MLERARELVRRSRTLDIFLWSRAALWLAALFPLAAFFPNAPAYGVSNRFTHDLGWWTDVWARWDSDPYIRVAQHGYESAHSFEAAFFPLYPAGVGVLGRAFGGHYVLAGILISLAACLVAFELLYRLAETRLGPDAARRAVVYLAVFPMSLFLQAVYTESLYLALVLGAFLLAERGRWTEAWAATGAAMLTRLVGVALIPALLVIAWRSPDRRRALTSAPIALAVFSIFPIVLWHDLGRPFAFVGAQKQWDRHFSPAGPFGGLWLGVRDGFTGLWRLLSQEPAVRHGSAVTNRDFLLHAGAYNVQALGFLVGFLALAVVAWRKLGAPYGLFALVSLAIPLSEPKPTWPLYSLPRFCLVIFPAFIALAALTERRPRLHVAVVGASAVMLGLAVVQWSLWQWVA